MKRVAAVALQLVLLAIGLACGPKLGDGAVGTGSTAAGNDSSESASSSHTAADSSETTASSTDGTTGRMLEPLGADAVVDLCTSRTHTCAASADGRVKCWGTSEKGALGAGSVEVLGDDELPIDIPEVDLPIDVVEVQCGAQVTCARGSDGAVACWGAARTLGLERGEEPGGDLGDDEIPGSDAIVPLDAAAVALSVAQATVCVALANETVRCWGSRLGFYEDWPRLGEYLGDDEPVTSVPALQVAGLSLLLTDFFYAGAVGDDGLLLWGQGAPNLVYTPSPRDGAIVDVALGQAQAGGAPPCAVMSSGSVACGTFDTLGLIEHDLGGPVEEVWGGVCFRVTGIGVRCYGHNVSGRLGLGNTDPIALEPTDTEESNVLSFGDVVVDISMSVDHTCAILEGGWLLCYGRGTEGALGYGSTDSYGANFAPEIEAAYRVFD